MDSQENNHNPEDTERKGLTNPKTNMEWALLYADNGWHVFPIHWIENGRCSCGRPHCSSPGKHPLTANGFKDATKDPQIIRNWWGKSPKANIAVATEVSGLFVMDVDQGPGKVGDKSLQTLIAQCPEQWPYTATARSGSGGLHIFFSADYDAAGTDTLLSRPDALGRHIDTRGRAGYLILPPSNHKSGGEYEWINRVKPVPVPDWLLRLSRTGVSDDDIGMADGERPFSYQWETDPDTGKIVDGRKQYLASLIWNARFTPDDESSVETAVERIISEFQAEADLSRPLGNVADRTQVIKDLHRAMRKARSSERDGLYPQIREMGGRLALVTPGRDTEKMVPITTFLIRPIRAIQVPERGEFLDVKLVGGSVEANVRLAPDVWLGARSFRQALNRSEMAFTGSDADVQRIKHYLSTLPMERIAGVAVAGMHDGKFVVSGGALGPNGPVHDLVLAGEQVRCDLLTTDKPTDEELAAMAECLPQVNVPEVVGPVLGWAIACFFKPSIMARYGQFPLLSVEGEAGAGKTSIVRHILMGLWGLSDEPKSIGDLTPFTRMKYVSSSNCIPVVFEENKSHKMSEAKKQNISSLIRGTYNGLEGARGRPEQTVTRYLHSAPVVIVGETGFCEEAVLDRMVFANMSRRDSHPHLEMFEKCRGLPLARLGRLVLDTALREPGRMNELINQEMDRVSGKLTDRPRFNAAVARAGLRLLEEICGATFDLASVDRAIAMGIAPDGDDETAHRKSAVVSVLEKMALMAEYGADGPLFSTHLKRGIHFAVVGDELRVPLRMAYALLQRWTREHGAEDDLIDEETFRKQVKKEPFFRRFSQARLGRNNQRCLILDLAELTKVADVGAFQQAGGVNQEENTLPF